MSRIDDASVHQLAPGTGSARRAVRLECGHTTTKPALVSFPNGCGMHECPTCDGRLVKERAR